MSLDTHLQTLAAQLAEQNADLGRIINEAIHDLRYGLPPRWDVADRMDAGLKAARAKMHERKGV
jgi:hypothetical protein